MAPCKDRPLRVGRWRIIPLLPALAAGVAVFVAAILLQDTSPNAMFEDDVYFYFQIACNTLLHSDSNWTD